MTSERLARVKTSAISAGQAARLTLVLWSSFQVETGVAPPVLRRQAGQGAVSCGFFRGVLGHPVVKPGPLRGGRVKFVIGKLAGFGPAPGLGGDGAQPRRPTAVGGFVAVGMQVGMEIRNRRPCAQETRFRKQLERVSERGVKMRIVRRSKSV